MSDIKDIIQKVIEKKEAVVWEDQIGKWNLYGYKMGEYHFGYCQCKEEESGYMFVLEKIPASQQLNPTEGSHAKTSGRKEWKDKIDIHTGMFRLLSAVEENAFLSLSSELFSGRILKALYEGGAFLPTKYNQYNGKADYQFMLGMFNKRNKDEITPRQQKKIAAILINSIKPYLKRQLCR